MKREVFELVAYEAGTRWYLLDNCNLRVPSNQALACCCLVTCPRELLLRVVCLTGVETRPAVHSPCIQSAKWCAQAKFRFDMFANTDFTTIFSKCWATSMATLWASRIHLGFVRTSPAGGESAKEMSSTRLRRRRRHQQLQRQQTGRMGAEAGAGDPGEGAVPRRRARRLLSQAAAADEK